MPASRSPWRPPDDVPPQRLFRLLVRRPRPWQPIAYRYPAAPDVALHVRALTPLELAEALDDAGDEGAPAEVASDRAMGRVVVAGLWEDHGPVFTSAEQAARMPHQAWGSLMDAALRGLAGIMPSRALCSADEWAEWRKALDKGARHPSNMGEAFRMRDCHDLVLGWRGSVRRFRPERYFGLPVADITDGQLLAFDAAIAAADDVQKKASATHEPD